MARLGEKWRTMQCVKGFMLPFVVLLCVSSSFADQLSSQIDLVVNKALENHKFVGASILVVEPGGRILKKHFGFRDREAQISPDENTLYELGSITKPLTRILLATQNKIQLNDKLSKHLPSPYRSPAPLGQEIKIIDLITHTGIKFSVPCTVRKPNLSEMKCFGVNIDGELLDPYINVTRENLFEFVNEYSYTVEELPEYFKKPGFYYSYSNVGMGLVGELLAQSNGTTYEDMLKSKVLQPLGMQDTTVTLPCESTGSCNNVAKVYGKNLLLADWSGKPLWHLPGMAGAGGVRSNLKDMQVLLTSVLNPSQSPLRKELATSMTKLSIATQRHNSNICKEGENSLSDLCNPKLMDLYYGWESVPGHSELFHGGQTGASQSMMLFSPGESFGVVILSNSKVGMGEQTKFHFPNDLALCIYQLAGRRLSDKDFCQKSMNIESTPQ
ncbi:MAG: serine hydrolase domain-containing protein [Bdellovibrionales bacterium]